MTKSQRGSHWHGGGHQGRFKTKMSILQRLQPILKQEVENWSLVSTHYPILKYNNCIFAGSITLQQVLDPDTSIVLNGLKHLKQAESTVAESDVM